MYFKDIIQPLSNGQKFTCKRWKNKRVYIQLIEIEQEVLIDINGKKFIDLIAFDSLIVNDDNRDVVTPFVPSVENIFYDEWERVD